MANHQNLDSIGKRIRAAREEMGISQADLAKAINFQSSTAVSLIESDDRKVSTETLEKLAEALHRSINYFLGQENSVVTVQHALRADRDLAKEDKDAILRFIELAKQRHGKR